MDTDSGSEIDDDNSHGNQQTQHLVAGKIAKVYLKNFLTHTEATVHPSEQLNLVSFLCSSSSFLCLDQSKSFRFSTLSAYLPVLCLCLNFTIE